MTEDTRPNSLQAHGAEDEPVDRVLHDFNNILTGIGSCAEIALGLLEMDHPARQYVHAIWNATTYITLPQQVRAKTPASEKLVVELNAAILEAETMLARLAGDNVCVVLDLADEATHVRLRAGDLERILINLTVNARDAMTTGGTLTIETSAGAQGHVVLRFIDTGEGMSEATRIRMTEPYFTTKPRYRGTGLGFSIVNDIIKLAGGKVVVDSAPKEGTTVELSFLRARVLPL